MVTIKDTLSLELFSSQASPRIELIPSYQSLNRISGTAQKGTFDSLLHDHLSHLLMQREDDLAINTLCTAGNSRKQGIYAL